MAASDPQVEHGFVQIASELFAALALAGFSRAEWAILHEVLAPMYGSHKTTSAHVRCHRAATVCGINRRNLSRALSGLVTARVVIRTGRGDYRLNKAYRQWRNAAGAPRVSDAAMVYCQVVRKGGEGRPAPPENGGAQRPQQGRPAPPNETDQQGRPAPPNPDEWGRPAPPNRPPLTLPPKRDPEEVIHTTRTCAGDRAREGADIADRVTAEVFGLREPDGSPDPDHAALLRQWLAGYSERACLAAAHEARIRAPRDPIRYLIGMCRKGLAEPPMPSTASGTAESPSGASNGTTGTPGAFLAVGNESPSKRAYREQLAKFRAAADREAAENAAAARAKEVGDA